MGHFTFHQLQIFAAVAEEKSVSRAAKKLYLSQPAVSMQLKRLESILGISLIEVIGKKVFITTEGQQLLQAHGQVQEIFSSFFEKMRSQKNALEGLLKIAGVSSSQYFLPLLLGAFRNQHPLIEVNLRMSDRHQIIQRLHDNEDDFVVMSCPPIGANIVSETIFEDELVVIASKNHRCATSSNLTLQTFLKEPFLMREEGSGTREIILKYFAKHDLTPISMMQLGSVEAIKEAVAAGFGISIVPSITLRQEEIKERFALLKVASFPMKHSWYAVFPKGKKPSSLVKGFLEFMKVQANFSSASKQE